MGNRRTGWAAAISILLIGAAIAGAWLVIAPSIFGTSSPTLNGPLSQADLASPAAAAVADPAPVAGSFQLSQPRDPFRPLITESSPAGTEGGATGTYEPSGTRVRLVGITDVGGVLRATVEVDSTSYDVGVGEAFGGSFMVVSLDTDSGVFLYGDNAFELSVGQEILK
ncbi:MAG: hypothetical protein GWP04_10930 [Gammaproteobacteria bacterium]|nr:hypothetical protein [Gammaproteobacteria bacterium]